MKIVFRTDASVTIGGGHVMRCLTLANTLETFGHECRFICVEGTDSVVKALREREHVYYLTPASVNDPHALGQFIDETADVLVIDHYGLGREYENGCRLFANKIMVIDDMPNRAHDADFIVDQTAGRQSSEYWPLVPAKCAILAGSAYCMIRPEFAQLRPQSLERRAGSAGINRLLITLGLTDPAGLTLPVLRSLAETGPPWDIDVVMGSGAPSVAQVIDYAETNRRVNVHVDAEEFAEIMAGADIAIGAGGITSWERCCLGLPSLMVAVADNQFEICKRLDDSGAAIYVGAAHDKAAQLVRRNLLELMDDAGRLRSMSAKAALVCDGLGARRVALWLDPSFGSDNQPVFFKPVTMEYGEVLYGWQRHPETRRFARNPAPPTRDEHFSWLSKVLANPLCIFNIIWHNNEPSGLIRLDPRPPIDRMPAYEVAIAVAPGKYRLGLGSAALHLVRKLVPEAVLIAEVLEGNEPSHKMFQKAGYEMENGLYYHRPQSLVSQVS